MENQSRKGSRGWLRLMVLLAAAALLASCAPKKKVNIPVYREEPAGQIRTEPPPSAVPGPPQLQPEPPLEAAPKVPPEIPPPDRTVPPPGQVGTLMARANTALQSGQPDKAELHLERALRLSPREPQLWHAMARVRFEQGNYPQAVQFCLKSNSLAGRDALIVRKNWLLMEKAYLKTGEKEKAAQARRKAAEKL